MTTLKTVTLTALLVASLGACSSRPYLEIGAGYTFNQVDYRNQIIAEVDGETYLFTGTDYGNCVIPAFLRAGVEWESGAKVGYGHDSNIDCGGPFNDRKEPHRDFIYSSWTFRGY